MPEGDTVWNTARALHDGVAGATIVRSQFRVPQLATADVAGWTIDESAARGKHLLLRLRRPDGRAVTLHSHLRMDGAWRTFRSGERWRGPSHTIRVVLETESVTAVGYHLHEIALVPTDEEDRLVGFLGPDLLGDDWDATTAVMNLRSKPERAIVDALLDQRNLAGVGNMYKSEVLFLRGVWPWRPVTDVPDLPALVDLVQQMMAAHRGRWRQSTTGSLRPGEEFYVYGRPNRPCRRCGTLIRRADNTDNERVTFWCTTCQPEHEGGRSA
ncbi:MAG TPA: DNA-formamidopyrimidine glycosylase family protein [Micromonosporaceae bacterium]|jgi:endonuclease-8|nr:DNA-formamidopyrimidine glycosylase family protein [Micromonosporaceae bacterium]